MNGMALLLVLAAPGIEYGWQPGADGKLEYIIQLEPQALDELKGGRSISSDLHPDVRGVRRFVLKVGEGPVPRIAVHPDALNEEDDTGEGETGATPPASRGSQSKPVTRGAPPLLRRGTQPSRTVSDQQAQMGDGPLRETNNQFDPQYGLSDEEDGGGAYERPPAGSRYSAPEQVDENERDDGLWSRWNPGTAEQDTSDEQLTDNQWAPEESESQPEIDPRDIPPDPDAAWAQGDDSRQPIGYAETPRMAREKEQSWRDSRPPVQPPEMADRTADESGEYMTTGYSQSSTERTPRQEQFNSSDDDSPSAEKPTPVALNEPVATGGSSSANDLFKELLLFASLGVNVAAVVIARQYYLRYCLLVQELRESESLSS